MFSEDVEFIVNYLAIQIQAIINGEVVIGEAPNTNAARKFINQVDGISPTLLSDDLVSPVEVELPIELPDWMTQFLLPVAA